MVRSCTAPYGTVDYQEDARDVREAAVEMMEAAQDKHAAYLVTLKHNGADIPPNARVFVSDIDNDIKGIRAEIRHGLLPWWGHNMNTAFGRLVSRTTDFLGCSN